MRKGDDADPKALIREAYRIDGITLPECRSIFMDWALSVETADPRGLIETLLERHGTPAPDHPMTQVLREGLAQPPRAQRRGGRAARLRES